MKSTAPLLLFCCTLFLLQACGNTDVSPREQKSVLLVADVEILQVAEHPFWKSLQDLAQAATFTVDTLSSAEQLREDQLAGHSTLILFQTDVNTFRPHTQSLLQRYTQAGGGLLSINTTSPLPYAWHWWQKAIPGPVDSIFQKKAYDGGRLVFANLDSLAWQTGTWKTELPDVLEYTIGDNTYHQQQIKSPVAPKFNRFTKMILDDNIDEPMELAVLPDNKVLFIERRGKMKLYDPHTSSTTVVANFDVCMEGNYEDGLLGLALDPQYGKENNWLYLYYAPPCENPNQLLSRFEFVNDTLSRTSEIVMLEVLVQRDKCCHSGGSVAFGPDGLLYLSTGDNTSSKESDGYTPIDERPGRGPFDAQKSSGNTHDLRGKILRIRPLADGTYKIPEGNLFPADGSAGRPEIYVMGARNPFRISIDAKTNYLYWGDVGPDSGKKGKYGPESLDEWNQARSPGNYGWPYFVGNNQAYPDRDFATGAVGLLFDPQRPVNHSPYNTGDSILPPARPAMIWYPYGVSEEFPLLGKGSRSAMAGPIYYKKPTYSKFSRFPEYYEGKLFIYEWARSWIKVLTMDEDGNLVQMEDFMPDTEFVKPIEMEIGPDGAMYVLEYGNQYFLNNPEAKLARIEFAEFNRAPIPKLSVDQANGAAPHRVQFSAKGSYDFDENDELIYEWYPMGTETEAPLRGEVLTFTYDKVGTYQPILKVTDRKGASQTATIKIQVGNAPPEVELAYQGNQSFYFDNIEPAYQVKITDQEDEIPDPQNASVSLSFLSDIDYVQDLYRGKVQLPEGSISHLEGKQQIGKSDCRSCHHEENKSIGPTYVEVARRYRDRIDAVDYLSKKVIKGGNGNWGKSMMAAHPQLSEESVAAMIQYILSLDDNNLMPLEGRVALNAHEGKENQGGYLLAASYRDQGANGIGGLTGRAYHILRNPQLQAEYFENSYGTWVSRFGPGLVQTQVSCMNGGFMQFEEIDLSGVAGLDFRVKTGKGGQIIIRLDSKEGPEIGQAKVRNSEEWFTVSAAIKPTSGIHNIVFQFTSQKAITGSYLYDLDWIRFKPGNDIQNLSSLK